MNLIKFIHLLFTLGLFGSAIYCVSLLSSKKFNSTHLAPHGTLNYMNKIMLLFGFFAMLTGSLLVIPKHFTFHTPWIQAAYILVTIFGMIIAILMLINKKRRTLRADQPLSRKERLIWLSIYLMLITILAGVIHDAVTKTTFLFT